MRGTVRWLTGLALALAVAWSAYWFVGERALARGTAAWFARMASEGRTASYAALDVKGYPSRFDVTLTEPRLGDPASGVEWSAPFVQLLTLSYTPWHVILALPDEQRMTWPGDGATVRSAKLQASVVVKPVPSVPLDRVVAVGEGIDLRTDGGLAVTAETARVALRALPGANEYELGLDLLNLSPDGTLRDAIAGAGLPGVVDEVRADAVATLSAPLDRTAPETRPQLARLDLRSASVAWGPLTVSATGSVVPDAQGLAEGTVTMQVTGWRAGLAAAKDAGLIDARTASTLATAAGMMAKGDALSLPVTFADGRTSVSLFPLGPAPRLR